MASLAELSSLRQQKGKEKVNESDEQGSSAAQTKAARKPKGTKRGQEFSKSDKKWLGETFLNRGGGQRTQKDVPLDPKAKERQRKVRVLQGYYTKFKGLIGESASDKKKVEEFLAHASNEDLDGEIARVQSEIAAPFTEQVCEKAVFFLLSIAEDIVSKHFWFYFGDITGATQDCKEDGDLETEITEIAILWDDWLRSGPYSRAFIKWSTRAALRARINQHSVINLKEGVEVKKDVVKEYENV